MCNVLISISLPDVRLSEAFYAIQHLLNGTVFSFVIQV